MKTINILLIDDDESSNALNELIIAESVDRSLFNTNIMSYISGTDALDYLENLKLKNESFPDLIFLDINMPVMDGWEFLEEYKKKGLHKNASSIVLMLSSSVWEGDIDRAKKHEFIGDFVAKPLTATAFPKILKEYYG